MDITYLESLPDKQRDAAAELLFDSLKEKFGPVLGDDARAVRLISETFNPAMCLTAMVDDQLTGLLVLQTKDQAGMEPTLKDMQRHYGGLGGRLRLLKLAILHHDTKDDEMHIGALAVSPTIRGQGVGSKLIDMAELTANQQNKHELSLEVVDINPRARALYERVGFKEVSTRATWPIRWFIKFPFKSGTLMSKPLV